MLLYLFHDIPSSERYYSEMEQGRLLERMRAIDAKARRKGLAALDPSRNPLIRIGMEIDPNGRVTKNGYGVFHLSWLAAQHPEWPGIVQRQAQEIRERIRQTHKAPLRFVIWAGMGGSAEDKAAYQACGLLAKGPRLYILDSTDPAKLKAILADMGRRSRLPLAEALKRTLVVGMAMGMTSYEPVVNLEKLDRLYRRARVDSRPNFIYLTLSGSLLDQFAGPRGYRRIEIQPDGGNTTAGRHSSPLTHGSLLPLALAGVDLEEWIRGTFLSDEEIHEALRLAAFLHAQGLEGRDKATLLLPKAWAGAALWTKQDFEESLGKSETLGIKIVIGEKVRLAHYRSPRDARQDRVAVAIVRRGESDETLEKATLIRRAGYPTAVVTFPGSVPLSRYMQFIHYAVFGLAFLRKMNFVTQPSVELYKAITSRIVKEAEQAGGIEKTAHWQRLKESGRHARFPGGVTFCFPHLEVKPAADAVTAAQMYASLCHQLAAAGKVRYAELTFFGDMRYSPGGRALRPVLNAAADRLFCGLWKMPVDIYEGPAMNHSYHEMIIGNGGCFSTVILAEKAERIAEADYTAEYHRAQFLATQAALAERGRAVVALLIKDTEESSRQALDLFFREAARYAKSIE